MKGNLPKLPKGMGSYEQRGDKIRYRKKLSFYGVECVASVTGESIAEVNRLMKTREREFEEKCRLHGTLNINLPLEVGMKKWLELYKKEELNEKSYDRIVGYFNSYSLALIADGLKDFIQQLYHVEQPSKYLASYAKFAGGHQNHPFIHDLVKNCFKAFIEASVRRYEGCETMKISFVGSVAYHFQSILEETLTDYGLTLGEVMPSPAEGLIRYYQSLPA